MILSSITVTVAWIAFSRTKDFRNLIVGIRVGTEIDEGIVQVGLLGDAGLIGILCVIIVTETTAKDIHDSSLGVLHI